MERRRERGRAFPPTGSSSFSCIGNKVRIRGRGGGGGGGGGGGESLKGEECFHMNSSLKGEGRSFSFHGLLSLTLFSFPPCIWAPILQRDGPKKDVFFYEMGFFFCDSEHE